MMGCKSGLQTKVKEIAPQVNVHCFIHRQALARKTLSENLKIVFNKKTWAFAIILTIST